MSSLCLQARWAVLVIILCAPFPVNAEATKAKCTCDLGSASDRENGAEVTNAAACFLTTDTGRKWCSFDIDSLIHSNDHRELVATLKGGFSSDRDQSALSALNLRFYNWINNRNGFATIRRFDGNANETLKTIQSTLDDKQTTILSCLENFQAGGTEDSQELIGDSRVQCGVHRNGWLTLIFGFNHFIVYFLVGP